MQGWVIVRAFGAAADRSSNTDRMQPAPMRPCMLTAAGHEDQLLTVQRALTVFGFISLPSTTDTQTHLISLFYSQCPFRTCPLRTGWLWYCSFLKKRSSQLPNTPHWLCIKTLTLKLKLADSWLGMSSVLREKANPTLSLHGCGYRQCRVAPNQSRGGGPDTLTTHVV